MQSNQEDKEAYTRLWDERYSEQEYAYGKQPNVFFKEQLLRQAPGRLLMPADGEGRNGVFAATLGWQVTSVDLSAFGRSKALELAAASGVNLTYLVGDLMTFEFEKESFDVIGLIFAHFSADLKSRYHRRLLEWLRPGGTVILEGFSRKHQAFYARNPKAGGGMDPAMLFSEEELLEDFQGCEIVLLEETEADLQEGHYHNGRGSVLHLVGRKLRQ